MAVVPKLDLATIIGGDLTVPASRWAPTATHLDWVQPLALRKQPLQWLLLLMYWWTEAAEWREMVAGTVCHAV
jgi:hypothetical protein